MEEVAKESSFLRVVLFVIGFISSLLGLIATLNSEIGIPLVPLASGLIVMNSAICVNRNDEDKKKPFYKVGVFLGILGGLVFGIYLLLY